MQRNTYAVKRGDRCELRQTINDISSLPDFYDIPTKKPIILPYSLIKGMFNMRFRNNKLYKLIKINLWECDEA